MWIFNIFMLVIIYGTWDAIIIIFQTIQVIHWNFDARRKLT